MQILLTNDDGVYAPGIRAMRKHLEELGRVTVVAPATEQSGVGHAITMHNPLVIHEVYEQDDRIGWQVEGSPADCVKLACLELIPSGPDLIVSGINYGSNAGINVLYSGTVAAAIEGAFFGIRSIAVSMEYHEPPLFDLACDWGMKVIRTIVRSDSAPSSLFNVNLPDLSQGPPKGIRVVPQGVTRYDESFERRVDPRGRTYFWPGANYLPGNQSADTDVKSMVQGFVTVTPLRFDLTHPTMMSAVELG